MQGKGPLRDLEKEREWRERMRRRERSGESVRAFCRREDLRESAFYAWRRELARRRQATSVKKQVPPGTKKRR